MPADEVHRRAPANFDAIRLPERTEHRAPCFHRIRFFLADDKFAVLGFAEIRSAKLVIVCQNWPTRIRINHSAVERSTARRSVSVTPKVSELARSRLTMKTAGQSQIDAHRDRADRNCFRSRRSLSVVLQALAHNPAVP